MFEWIKQFVFITLILGTAVSFAEPVNLSTTHKIYHVKANGENVEISVNTNFIFPDFNVKTTSKSAKARTANNYARAADKFFIDRNDLAKMEVIAIPKGEGHLAMAEFAETISSKTFIQSYGARLLQRINGKAPQESFPQVLKRKMRFKHMSIYDPNVKLEDMSGTVPKSLQEGYSNVKKLYQVLGDEYDFVMGDPKSYSKRHISYGLGIIRFMMNGAVIGGMAIITQSPIADISLAQAGVMALPAASLSFILQQQYENVTKIMSHSFESKILAKTKYGNDIFNEVQYLTKQAAISLAFIWLVGNGVVITDALFHSGPLSIQEGMSFSEYLPWVMGKLQASIDPELYIKLHKAGIVSGLISVAAGYGIQKLRHDTYFHGARMTSRMASKNINSHFITLGVSMLITTGQVGIQYGANNAPLFWLSTAGMTALSVSGLALYLAVGDRGFARPFRAYMNKAKQYAAGKCINCADALIGLYDNLARKIHLKANNSLEPKTCGSLFARAF